MAKSLMHEYIHFISVSVSDTLGYANNTSKRYPDASVWKQKAKNYGYITNEYWYAKTWGDAT